MPGPGAIAVFAAVAVYAWWAAGLAPFTATAYTAVALPVVGLAVAAFVLPDGARSGTPGGPDAPPRYGALPWVALLLAAVALETAGLALGGRSSNVPTLSTVIDHALAWHGVRFALFLAWLALGWTPVVRRAFRWPRPGA